jgi:hypothetical protein
MFRIVSLFELITAFNLEVKLMGCVFGRWSRGAPLLFLVAIGGVALLPAMGKAGFVIDGVPNISIPYGTGGSGSFEVDLISTAPDLGSTQIAADQVQLNLPSQSYVTFTNETASTTNPYIFGGSLLGAPSFSSSTSTSAYVTDAAYGGVGYAVAGADMGLLKVSYNVAANTPAGTYNMVFNVNDPNSDAYATYLIDPTFSTFYPFSATNGSITVLSPVPEPSSMVLTGLAAIGGLGFCRFRRRSARKA